LLESVELIAKITSVYKNKFIIAGPIFNKIYWEKVKSLLKDYKINYDYVGEISSNDINKLLRKTNYLITCSKKEGLPNIVLEALSNGVPVIGSSIEPHKELIVDGYNGFLLNNSKKNFLLWKDKSFYNRLSSNAIKSISEFDIIKIKEKYKNLYSSLILQC